MKIINGQNIAHRATPRRRGKSLLPSVQMLLILIIIFGAWLRFDAAVNTVVENPIRADAGRYVAYAYNMNHWNTYSLDPLFRSPATSEKPEPDAIGNPGYPAFLSLVLGQSEPDWAFVKKVILLQALIGTLAIPLTFVIGARLMPPYWALTPSILAAISPKLIISGTYVLTESIFTALLLASLAWIIVKTKAQHILCSALIGGLLLATTALVRPTTQYVVPFILIAVLPMLSKAQRWKYSMGMIIGFLILTTPWMLRNIIATGHSSDSTMTISALVHGHYPNTMYDSRPETYGYPYRFDPKVAEISQSVPHAIEGIAGRISESPGKYLSWYLLGKPITFLSWQDPAAVDGIFTYPTLRTPYQSSKLFKTTLVVMESTHWLWVILALMVTICSLLPQATSKIPSNQLVGLRICAMTIIYFLLVHAAGFPIARYHIPLLPVIFILATYALFATSQRIAGRQKKPPKVKL